MELLVDGRPFDDDASDIADTCTVEVVAGYLQGPQKGCPEELAKALAWWLRKQTNITVLVEVDRTRLKELDLVLKGVGGVRL